MASYSRPQRLVTALCHMAVQVTLASVLLALAGCSTAPFADIMDYWAPGRFPKDAKGVTGGVCLPQGGPAGGMLGPPQPLVTSPGPPSPPSPPGPPAGGLSTNEPPPAPPPR
jgi:hypothetical protein